jgi:putative membrane protein
MVIVSPTVIRDYGARFRERSGFMIALLARRAVFALGVALGAASYAQTSPPKPAAPAAKNTLNQEDRTFVKEAGAGGLAEVELSKIAQKSENADVKRFADRMVQDHTAANQELTTIATGLGINLPKALDPEHEQMRKKLAALHGKAFEEQYMQGMVADHNKAGISSSRRRARAIAFSLNNLR